VRPPCPFLGANDKGLEERYSLGMDSDLAARFGSNVKHLRETRGATQAQMAKLAGVPRATWANLESGAANPTLAVIDRVANALQVTIEELVAVPRASAQRYARGVLPVRQRGEVTVLKLLPDPIPGMEIDRIELPAGARMAGVPHTPGTREYLTCESGEIVLVAAGEKFELGPGDLVAFHGDQRHSYANPGKRAAVGYSVVVLAR
jgi:XRE family transcriptional regulator, regulator of sulfur utilization